MVLPYHVASRPRVTFDVHVCGKGTAARHLREAAYFGAKGVSSDSSVTAWRPFAIVIHFWAIIRSSARVFGSFVRSASATHSAANSLSGSVL